MTRRTFLSSATSIALTGVGATEKVARPFPQEGIIDTHTHFYDPTRPQGVPWPPENDKLLYRRVLPEDLRTVARPVGVVGTVVVEASEWIEDNQWLLDLAKDDGFLLGIVGFLRPGTPGFNAQLRQFGANPLFRGIRVGTWGGFPDVDEPRVLDDMKRVADSGLTVDMICRAEQLPHVARVAGVLPHLDIVVDHVANVRIDGGEPPLAWEEGMRALSACPRVFCKLSGLVEGSGKRNGDAPTDVDFYRPVLDVVWRCFGIDRLIWSSNWPVSERFAPYGTTLQLIQDYLADQGETAKEKLFRQNAIGAYALPGKA